MARFLTQTLIRPPPPPSIILQSIQSIQFHQFSTQSSKSKLIEVDLDSSEGGEVGLRKLEDVIHNIIVRQSAPDWLPFVPGSSYWVPPQRRMGDSGYNGLFRVLKSGLSEDESLSLGSSRGWPSSAYFIQGTSPVHPVEVEVDKKQDEEG